MCFEGLLLFWESLPNAFGLGRQYRGQELVRTGQLFLLFEWRMQRGKWKMVFLISIFQILLERRIFLCRYSETQWWFQKWHVLQRNLKGVWVILWFLFVFNVPGRSHLSFAFQEYRLDASKLFGPSSLTILSAFLLSPRGTLGLLPPCLTLQG